MRGSDGRGRTKRLTFTEGRLRLHFNALPDLKVRRLGRQVGGPMILALIFSVSFLSREKKQKMPPARAKEF